MTTRPRPAFAIALATALAGSAPVPAGAQKADEPKGVRCYTEALTEEEVEEGVYSEVQCYPLSQPASRAHRLAVDYAILYTGFNGGGSSLTVGGSSCNGGAVNFAPGSAWDNVVSSTDLLNCGSAKHYVDPSYGGANQLVSGGGIHNMNATLNDKTSSIQYAP